MEFNGFDWDNGNWPKCGKHGLSKGEIESIFEKVISIFPDPYDSGHEKRFRGIGEESDGRHVFIVFCLRGKNGLTFLRPISARYMHAKEIRHFRQRSA